MDLREQIDKTLKPYTDPDDGTMPTWDSDGLQTWRPVTDVRDELLAVVQPEIDEAKADAERGWADSEQHRAEAAEWARTARRFHEAWQAAQRRSQTQTSRLRLAWQSARAGRRSARLLSGELTKINRGLHKVAQKQQLTIDRVRAIAERDPDQCGPSEDRGVTCPTAADLRAALDQPGDQEDGTTWIRVPRAWLQIEDGDTYLTQGGHSFGPLPGDQEGTT